MVVLREDYLGVPCWPSGWDSGHYCHSLVSVSGWGTEILFCKPWSMAEKKKKKKRKKRILQNLEEIKMNQILFVCGDVINVTFQTLSWMQCFQYFFSLCLRRNPSFTSFRTHCWSHLQWKNLDYLQMTDVEIVNLKLCGRCNMCFALKFIISKELEKKKIGS